MKDITQLLHCKMSPLIVFRSRVFENFVLNCDSFSCFHGVND